MINNLSNFPDTELCPNNGTVKRKMLPVQPVRIMGQLEFVKGSIVTIGLQLKKLS